MRRSWAGMAATAMVVGTLTGCGLGGTGTATGTGPVTGAVKGTVTLQTWALKPKFTTYVQGVINGFQRKYPGATVKWLDQPADGYSDKVLSQAAGGTLPDVSNLPPDFALPLVNQGFLLDVGGADPKMTGEYVAGGLDAYRYPGRAGVYGYPWYLNTDVNYWNSEMLKRYGLDASHPPATLDQLIAQAEVVKQKSGGKAYLMSRKPGLSDLANAGVKLMSDDGKSFVFNTPQAAAVLDRYRDAFKRGLLPQDVLTTTYAGNAKLFAAGTVGWTTGGGDYISSLATDNPSLAMKVVPSAAMGTPPLYVQGLSISKKSRNLPTAVALARWVTSADNQKAFAHLVNIFPSTKASANDPYFSKSDGTNSGDAKVIAFTSLANARMVQPVEVTSAMSDTIDQQFALAISGSATSKQALDAAAARCNQMLKS